MDLSNKYIEMCSQAKELQSYHNENDLWQVGDKFAVPDMLADGIIIRTVCKIYRKKEERFIRLCGENGTWESDCQRMFDVWLPYQHQIQDLMTKGYEDIHHLLASFATWHNREFVELYYKLNIDSGEQLWLAFYQSKLYHKVWDDKCWRGL